MRYMLLCYGSEKAWEEAGESALREARAEAVGLTHELNANGNYIAASPLQSISTATTFPASPTRSRTPWVSVPVPGPTSMIRSPGWMSPASATTLTMF